MLRFSTYIIEQYSQESVKSKMIVQYSRIPEGALSQLLKQMRKYGNKTVGL